jgi:CO/xanthine dehydrogenase FAD-binding subunit
MAQAARTVGSPQIRSVGTLGGNLGTASPAGDGLPWLAALDAGIELASAARGRRTVPWDEFVVGVKATTLQPDEVITAAVLPETMPVREEFAKIGVRNAMVIATVSACVMRMPDDTWRIALGAVAPTPMRAYEAEALLAAAATPTDAVLDGVGRVVAAEVRPITDHRSTEAYRRHAAGVLVRRLVARCAA